MATETKVKIKAKGKAKAEKGLGFTITEGLLVEALASTKSALDVLYRKESELPVHKVFRGVFNIAAHEATNIENFFDGLNEKTISPKHRLAKRVSKTYLDNLKKVNLEEVEDENDPAILQSAKLIISFMTTMHYVLHADSSDYVRKKKTEDFCLFWGDSLEEAA